MIPPETTQLILQHEMAGASKWAERHSVPLQWRPERLEVRAILKQPETDELFYLRGVFDDYRRLPPAWTFTSDEESTEAAMHFAPRVDKPPFGSSLFIKKNNRPVICAPFNRLAYAEHNGPHANWRGAANWLTAGQPNRAKAHYLGDMLQVIYRDFCFSRGRMG